MIHIHLAQRAQRLRTNNTDAIITIIIMMMMMMMEKRDATVKRRTEEDSNDVRPLGDRLKVVAAEHSPAAIRDGHRRPLCALDGLMDKWTP